MQRGEQGAIREDVRRAGCREESRVRLGFEDKSFSFNQLKTKKILFFFKSAYVATISYPRGKIHPNSLNIFLTLIF